MIFLRLSHMPTVALVLLSRTKSEDVLKWATQSKKSDLASTRPTPVCKWYVVAARRLKTFLSKYYIFLEVTKFEPDGEKTYSKRERERWR